MEWLINLWKKIVESDNQPLLNTIKEKKQEVKAKDKYIKNLYQDIDELNTTIENNNQEIQKLETSIIELSPKPVSELSLKDFFKVDRTRYTWKPGKRIYLHKSLQNFSEDEDYIAKYFAFMQELGLDDSYSSVDWCVYDIITKVQKYINDTLPDDYDTDLESFNAREYWLSPQEAFDYYVEDRDVGDCFAGYEEIYTKDGLKKIKDIKVDDKVLSYDFEQNKYVYKKVIKHWDKGNLQVNRVHFRNGQTMDVSENHPMWHRINKTGKSEYEKQYLSKIDLNNWFKRKVPIAKKIPYTKSEPLFSKELYRVIGHYVAEGWEEGSHVNSSGYELTEDIIPILEKNDIPFSEYINNSGVPCIRFLTSDFKKYLKLLKTNSFNINLPEEILTLPEDYLKELLYGMWLGDGTKKIVNITKNSQRDWIYSTSSKKLAEDIQRIGLQLGDSYHIWKQENHQGVGTKPIYRITHNSNSCFLRDFGNEGISEVSISFIEKLDKTQMFDLTVEDTHTVIMKNGIITHQCEDTSAFLYGAIMSVLITYHYDDALWRLVRVDINFPVGHAVVTWLKDNHVWACIESTYGERRFRRNWLDNKDMFKGVYTGIWHIFNEQTEYKERY